VGRGWRAACAGLRRWAARLHPDADALQASEAPALLVQSRGESALVNYRVGCRTTWWTALRHRGPDRRRWPSAGSRDDPAEGGRAVTPQRDDPSSAGPPGSRRRGCRWCGLIAACSMSSAPSLVVVVVAGSLRCGLRARGSCRTALGPSLAGPACGRALFDKVPDREPSAPPTSADTPSAVPPSALHLSTQSALRPRDAELDQRRDRAAGAPPWRRPRRCLRRGL